METEKLINEPMKLFQMLNKNGEIKRADGIKRELGSWFIEVVALSGIVAQE